MKTQREMILRYMRIHGGITQREAFLALGVSRLAARIHELVNEGYEIERHWEKVYNRFGADCMIVRYTLKDVGKE